MKYIDFYNHFKEYPIIHLSDIKNAESDFDHRRLYEWQKKHYLKKVANNFYIFADKQLSDFEMNFISNKLYEPSYLSFEYSLSYYDLIPETVFLYTSVTTKKTRIIKSEIGNFSYRNIKTELFFGYRLIKNEKISFKIADPEKALLDFLYFRSDIVNKNDVYELRLNKEVFKETIGCGKLNNYLRKFNSKKITQKIKLINAYVGS